MVLLGSQVLQVMLRNFLMAILHTLYHISEEVMIVLKM